MVVKPIPLYLFHWRSSSAVCEVTSKEAGSSVTSLTKMQNAGFAWLD